jgi:hypothetical protein
VDREAGQAGVQGLDDRAPVAGKSALVID